jgi:D-aspartate ligase
MIVAPAGQAETGTAFKKNVPVLLMKIGNYPLVPGALAAVRSLAALQVPVFAVVESRFSPAAVSRYLSGAFVWDAASLSDDVRLAGMREMADRIGQRSILLPTDDAASVFIAEWADELTQWFWVVRPSRECLLELVDKAALPDLCASVGLRCPTTVYARERDELQDFLARSPYPLICKPARPWRIGSWVPNRVIHTENGARAAFAFAQASGIEVIFQEYVDPELGEDWFYGGCRNARKGHIRGFTGRKLRSHPHGCGAMSWGESRDEPDLRREAEKLLEAVDYNGIVDIDFRRDRAGHFHLLDFNPRLGAQFRLFRTNSGHDLLQLYYLELVGRPIEVAGAQEWHSLLNESADLLLGMSMLKDRRMGVQEWLSPWRKASEWAWLDKTDLVPFISMSAHLLASEIGASLGGTAARKSSKFPRPRFKKGRENWHYAVS